MPTESENLKRVGYEAEIIGRNLARLRRAHGCSQAQVAQALETSFQQVQKYEKGKNRIPAEKLYLLKVYFGVPYDAFFEGLIEDDLHEAPPKAMVKQVAAGLLAVDDARWQRKLLRAALILVS